MLHYLGTDVPIKNLADSTSPSVGILLGTLVCSGSLYNRDYAHVIPVDMAELKRCLTWRSTPRPLRTLGARIIFMP